MSKPRVWEDLYAKWKEALPGPKKQFLLGKIVTQFEPLIASVIRRYSQVNGTDIADLKQAARIGFMRAVELFDPQKRTAFPPYALLWIRQSVTRELRVLRGKSTTGASVNLIEFQKHNELFSEKSETPEDIYINSEHKKRWTKWLPDKDTVKVINEEDPLEFHRTQCDMVTKRIRKEQRKINKKLS